MATSANTVDFILAKLGRSADFSARPMFGEHALYANGKVVALICDNQLYVKVFPASAALEKLCDKDAPYPGAKPHYLIEEAQLSTIPELPAILLAISKSLPSKLSRRKRA
jgi:TfoX/Sxy family transcriptional regulator of competence genes